MGRNRKKRTSGNPGLAKKKSTSPEPDKGSDAESNDRQLDLPGVQATLAYQERSFAGPWPPPETMQKYALIDKEFPAKIVAMADEEQRIRHEMTRRDADRMDTWVHSEMASRKLGQWLALCVSVAGLTAAGLVAILANPWAGAALGGASLGTIVTAFIYGSRAQKNSASSDEEPE